MKKRLISMILAITMMVIFLPLNLVTAVQEEKSVPVSNAEMSNEEITRLSPVEHDWKAKWIWTEDNTSKHNWIAARKTFEISDLNAIDEQVLAMVAVDSRYWL